MSKQIFVLKQQGNQIELHSSDGFNTSTNLVDPVIQGKSFNLTNGTPYRYALYHTEDGKNFLDTGVHVDGGNSIAVDNFDPGFYSSKGWFVLSPADDCGKTLESFVIKMSDVKPEPIPATPGPLAQAAAVKAVAAEASNPLDTVADVVKTVAETNLIGKIAAGYTDLTKASCSVYWFGWIILVVLFFLLTWIFCQFGGFNWFTGGLLAGLIVFVVVGWLASMGVPKQCSSVLMANSIVATVLLVIVVILGIMAILAASGRKNWGCSDGVELVVPMASY